MKVVPILKKSNSSTITQAKLCVSGLSKNELQIVENELFRNQNTHTELLDGTILHPDCTHLLTKTTPGLAKTEKVLSALARGIPILDIKYLKEFLKQKSHFDRYRIGGVKSQINFSDPGYIDQYDIGGKHLSNGQVLPKLANRAGAKVFENWGKVAILLEGRKADVYSRILAEGGAKGVILLTMPFNRSELFAGLEDVEEIQFSHILSEPSYLQSDPMFRYFVDANPSNIHICTYLYVIECLSKEVPSNPQSFYLNRISTDNLHRYQQTLRQKQTKLTNFLKRDPNHHFSPQIEGESKPIERQGSQSLFQGEALSSSISHTKRRRQSTSNTDVGKEQKTLNKRLKLKEEGLSVYENKNVDDKYEHQYPNMSISTPNNNSMYQDNNKLGNCNIQMNASLSYGTPSVKQYLESVSTKPTQKTCVISRTASKSRHRPPIEVITLDSPQEGSSSTIEVARTQEDDSVVILEHCNKAIKRTSSVNDTRVIVISDSPLKLSSVQKTNSLPITPTSSLSKPRRVARRIVFDNGEKLSTVLNSAGYIRHSNVSQPFTQGSDSSMGSHTISVYGEGRRRSLIGTESLKIATDCVQMQKYFNLMRGGEWCDKDSRMFMGSLYRYEAEINGDLEEDGWTYIANDTDSMYLCYQTFFETYTSSARRGFHTTEEESADLWLAILDFLEEGISSAEGNPDEHHNIAIIHSILIRGVRENSSVSVRHAAFGFIQRLVLYQHPPHTPGMRNYYKKLFVRRPNCTAAELNNFDGMEMWDFFYELVEETVDVCCNKRTVESSGPYMTIQLILMILESDFQGWTECCLNICKLVTHWPMVGRLFWPEDIGYANNRIKQILKAYASILCVLSSGSFPNNIPRKNASLAASILRRIICMLAQLVDLCDKNKGQNTFKANLAETLATSILNMEKSTKVMIPDTVLWAQLYRLKPDWFSASVTRNLTIKVSKTMFCDASFTTNIQASDLLMPLRKAREEMEEIQDKLTNEIFPATQIQDNKSTPRKHPETRKTFRDNSQNDTNKSLSEGSSVENKENENLTQPLLSNSSAKMNEKLLTRTPNKLSNTQLPSHLSTTKSLTQLSSSSNVGIAPLLTSPCKINVTRRNRYGETALHVACRNGNVSRVIAILSTPNVEINARDNDGWTPLHEAASNGRLDCVEKLLSYKPRTIRNFFTSGSYKGMVNKSDAIGETNKLGESAAQANLWAVGGVNRITPLADAIRSSHLHIVEKLIDHILLKNSSYVFNHAEKIKNSIDPDKIMKKEEHLMHLRQMLEMRTKDGKNSYELAIETGDGHMTELLQTKIGEQQCKNTDCNEEFTQSISVEANVQEDQSKPNRNKKYEPSNASTIVKSKSHDDASMTKDGSLPNNPPVAKDLQGIFDRRRYWTLCSTYFYKYCAAYRLHATKLIMKELANSTTATSSTSSLSTSSNKDNGIQNITEERKIIFSDRRMNISQNLLVQFSCARSAQTVAQDIRTFWSLGKKGNVNPAINVLLH